MNRIMTCSEVVMLVYRFSESRPSSDKQRVFRDHLLHCVKCQEFLEKIGQRFGAGNFDVGCYEIPDELLDLISCTLRKMVDPHSEEELTENIRGRSS